MSLWERLFGSKSEDQIKQLADQLSGEVSYRVKTALQNEFVALAEVDQATQKVVELTKEIAVLKAEKAGIEEGFARKEREIEHKVGLLRTEIEAEKKQSEKDFELRVKEAKLQAAEANLTERAKAFSEKMDFMEQRFTGEVGYLKELLEQMSKRLPDATILATKEL